MKKRVVTTMTAAMTAMMMAGSLVACGSATNTAKTANTATTTEKADAAVKTEDTAKTEAPAKAEDTTTANADATLSGKISLAGSTSMEKLCEAMSESFMEDYPGVTVTVEYTGSGAGIESLEQGSVDIGNASRALKDGEKESGAVENIVAIDGIAVITDKSNTVMELTTENLADIYTGKVKSWSDLGGSSDAIVVIGREAGSGTRGAFEELLKVEDNCAYAQELDSTGAVLAKVASTPGAIGYISLDAVDDSIQTVALDGVAASEENISAGKYSLSRPFVMATMGEVSAQNDLVQKWFEYVRSEKGQSVIAAVGLILPQ